MQKRFSFISVLFVVCMGAAAASAQPPVQSQDGWRVGLGGGALFSPSYLGDDEYRLSALPSIRVEYGDLFFASIENGVGFNAVNRGGFQAGPIARIRFGRDEDGSQPFAVSGDRTGDLIGLGDVDATAELGAFFKYEINGFTSTVEARKGVNGHEGAIIDASINYGGRSFVLGPPLIYSIGPRVKFAGDRYHSAYFGVSADQSLASGLPQYSAAGGLSAYGIGAMLIMPLSRDNSMSAILVSGYDRLGGDAADAPLVQERGSRDQASIGLFFTYWFQ